MHHLGLVAAYRSMWVAPLLAVSTTFFVVYLNPRALAVATPILALWFASPLFAWWLSRPLSRPQPRLERDQVAFLRMLSRKTWAFFEHVIGEDDHWLPPDNLQENPGVVVAHRTSPTNMGLSLLANLAAHDFGYLSTGQLVARTAQCVRHDAPDGALSRPLFQLVRHAHIGTATAAIRFDGGQRKFRWSFVDIATGIASACGAEDLRCALARRFRGHARGGPQRQ